MTTADTLPPAGRMPKTGTPTLFELLHRRARLTPDAEAYVDGDLRLTFADAKRRAVALSDHLAARGVKPGDRVAILAKNGDLIATGLFAAARLGAIAVTVNWRLPVPELVHVLTDSDPTMILHDEEFMSNVDGFFRSTGTSIVRVIRHDSGQGGYADIVSGSTEGTKSAVIIDADTPALIMYTSGTTGRAKGAVLTHANLFWSASGMTATMPWEASHRFLLGAPMFHIGGLAPLIANVLSGSATVFLRDFDPVAVWEIVQRERITTMMTVPLMAKALLHVARTTEVDSSSLLNISCGASPVPPDLVTAFAERGIVVQMVYGVTEFSGVVCYSAPYLGDGYEQTQGRAVFHSEVKVVDPQTGEAVPTRTAGEVWVRGPQRFAGYWKNPEATEQAITPDGWYRTGDVGYLDENGAITLVDRLKDMIISGGENIYSAELESVIGEHPLVKEIAVVGEPDETWGEVPVAYIVTADTDAISAERLTAWSRERLASFKIPKRFEFIDQLPVNAVGKILKGQLRGTAGNAT